MNHAQIIRELGAPAIAARLGCHLSRPHRWAHEGIPANRWVSLAEMARDLGKPITLETLAAATPVEGSTRG